MLRWWINRKVETAEMFTWKCNFSLLPIYWKPPTGQSLEKKSFQLKKMFLQIPAGQKIHFLCSHPRQAGSIQKWPIWNSVPRLRRRPRNAIILRPNLIHSDSNSVSEFLCLSSTRVCVFWPKPFNIPSPTSNNSWHQLLLVNHREGQLTFVPESPGIPILDLALRPKIWTWHCRRIKSLLQYLPFRWEGKKAKFSFQMLNIDQLGFNLNFCAPFPAALVDLLDRNLIDWEKEKLHWPSGVPLTN